MTTVDTGTGNQQSSDFSLTKQAIDQIVEMLKAKRLRDKKGLPSEEDLRKLATKIYDEHFV